MSEKVPQADREQLPIVNNEVMPSYEYSDVTPEMTQRAARVGKAVMQLASVQLEKSIDHTDAIVDRLEGEGRYGVADFYARIADSKYIEGSDAFFASAAESMAEHGDEDVKMDIAALKRVDKMLDEANAYKVLREKGLNDKQADEPERLRAQIKKEELRKRLATDMRVKEALEKRDRNIGA